MDGFNRTRYLRRRDGYPSLDSAIPPMDVDTPPVQCNVLLTATVLRKEKGDRSRDLTSQGNQTMCCAKYHGAIHVLNAREIIL